MTPSPNLTVCIDVGRGGFAWATAGERCDSGRQPVDLASCLKELEPRALSLGLEAPLFIPPPGDPMGQSSKEQRKQLVRQREADPEDRDWFRNSGGATGMMAIPILAWILDITKARVEVWEAMITSDKPEKIDDISQDRTDAIYGAHLAHGKDLKEVGEPVEEDGFWTPTMVARELGRAHVEVTGLVLTVKDSTILKGCGAGCEQASG